MINKSSIGFSSLKMVIAQVLTPVIFFRQFSRLIVYLNQKWSQRSRCLSSCPWKKNNQLPMRKFTRTCLDYERLCKVLIDFYWFLARINSLEPGDIVLKLFGSRPLDLFNGKPRNPVDAMGISNIQKLPPPKKRKKCPKSMFWIFGWNEGLLWKFLNFRRVVNF